MYASGGWRRGVSDSDSFACANGVFIFSDEAARKLCVWLSGVRTIDSDTLTVNYVLLVRGSQSNSKCILLTMDR
jgi:hypothetical protein